MENPQARLKADGVAVRFRAQFPLGEAALAAAGRRDERSITEKRGNAKHVQACFQVRAFSG